MNLRTCVCTHKQSCTNIIHDRTNTGIPEKLYITHSNFEFFQSYPYYSMRFCVYMRILITLAFLKNSATSFNSSGPIASVAHLTAKVIQAERGREGGRDRERKREKEEREGERKKEKEEGGGEGEKERERQREREKEREKNKKKERKKEKKRKKKGERTVRKQKS